MPEGKDPTPGFSMSDCIERMSKVKGVSDSAAICMAMYKKGKTKSFPEKISTIYSSGMGPQIFILKEARTYIKSPSQAPKGTTVTKGPKGGYYYDKKVSGDEEPAMLTPEHGAAISKRIDKDVANVDAAIARDLKSGKIKMTPEGTMVPGPKALELKAKKIQRKISMGQGVAKVSTPGGLGHAVVVDKKGSVVVKHKDGSKKKYNLDDVSLYGEEEPSGEKPIEEEPNFDKDADARERGTQEEEYA